MLKKYFIRKTQADLLQEQINLMERMLERSPTSFNTKMLSAKTVPEQEQEQVIEVFDFSMDDDVTYIPKQSESITATNLTVKTSTAKIDEDNIKKLKKIRADATQCGVIKYDEKRN